MQLRESSAINASILIMWPDTSRVCILSKVNMADSSSTESSSTSGSDYSDFEAFIEGEDNERVYDPISEIRPWRFEPPGWTEEYRVRVGRESRARVPWLPQSGKWRMVSTIREYNTFLNIVSENQSLIKYRSDQVNQNQMCRLLSSLEAKWFMLHAGTFRSLGFTDWK